MTLGANQMQVRQLVGNSSNTTGRRASAPFIGVLRVRDGKTVLWRECQNALATAQALDQLPRPTVGRSRPTMNRRCRVIPT
jgi:hypothetical protein